MKKLVSMLLTVAMLAACLALPVTAAAEKRYSVDFGTAAWTVDGAEVTAHVDGLDLTAGPVELNAFDAIRLEGFDGGRMIARVNGENGFSAVLEPNGENEVSLGRPVETDTFLPDTLRFEVTAWAGPGGDPHEGGGDPMDRRFTVDFGTAAWTVNGVEVTAAAWGQDLTQGVLEVEGRDMIRLDGLDPAAMQVRVYAEDGFSAELAPNENNEVCLGRPADPNVNLPDPLRFEVEARPADEPDPDPGNGTYTVDFGGAAWLVDGENVTARVDGKDITKGPVELTDQDVIRLDGFDGGRMTARVYAPDGFSADLDPNGDNEVSLGRRRDPNVVLPQELRFEVEAGAPGPGGPGGDPENRVFTVDFGTAAWTVNGVEVTAVSWGLDLTQGVVEIGGRDAIRLNGLDPATMRVRVYGENDFAADLAPNENNEVCLDAPADPDVFMQDTLRFAVEPREQDAPDALLGDVDGNGEIEAGDARLALRIAVGLEAEMEPGTREYELANVTEIAAGEVNAADARCILRRAVGFEDPEFGV